MLCPYCNADILEISKKCPHCGNELLSDEDARLVQEWIYKPREKSLSDSGSQSVEKKTFMKRFLSFDPIIRELVMGGLKTYFSHINIYIILILSYIMIFSVFAGIFSYYGDIAILFPSLGDPIQVLFGSSINYIIALFITMVTQYFAFKSTLSSGELGLVYELKGSNIEQIIQIFLYSAVMLFYLILWATLARIVYLLAPNAVYTGPNDLISRVIAFLFSFSALFIIMLFVFFITSRFSYSIYTLDEDTVPLQVIDPMLFILGLMYGALIFILNIVPVLLNITMAVELVAVITFIIPGTLIIPVFAYSMAHLKIASSLINYEGLPLPDGVTI